MNDSKDLLNKLNQDLNILQEREAKYGGNKPSGKHYEASQRLVRNRANFAGLNNN